MFSFLPANLKSSTYTDKINPFSRWRKETFPIWNFSHPCFNRIFSKLPSPQQVLPKDDHTKFLSRKTPGSIMLDHNFVHLCRGRRIQMSGHTDSGIFSTFWSIFHFRLEFQQILRPLRNREAVKWYPWFWLLSFVMPMIFALWILHKSLNRPSRCHPGVRLDLCTFGVSSLIQNSSADKCPSTMRNVLSHICVLLLRSLQICFLNFRQIPRQNFLNFSPFFVHCFFCCRYFHRWRHGNKNCVQNINDAVNCRLFVQYGLHEFLAQFPPYTHTDGLICFYYTCHLDLWSSFSIQVTTRSRIFALLQVISWNCLFFPISSVHFLMISRKLIPCPLDRWNKYLGGFRAFSSLWSFTCPILFSPFILQFLDIPLQIFGPHMIRSGSCFAVSLVSSWPHVSF